MQIRCSKTPRQMQKRNSFNKLFAEEIARRCSGKKVFLKISHTSQEKNRGLFFDKVVGSAALLLPYL